MLEANVQTLRFLCADENGSLKSILCPLSGDSSKEPSVTSLSFQIPPTSPAHRLSTCRSKDGVRLLGCARRDGTISAYTVPTPHESPLQTLFEIREDRMRSSESFAGLEMRDSGLYTCTSAGHLRYVPILEPGEGEPSFPSSVSSLPTRLKAMRVSSSCKTLAYAGDEVNLSLWDTEKALGSRDIEVTSSNSGATKRKKSKELLPGEIWRAKNEQNDFLSLREPVHVTCLAYVSEDRLVTGNHNGGVKFYDTRRGSKAVANWEVHKVSVKVIESGKAEHEIFTADSSSNLSALDTRNGRVLYSYKGIAGAVTSISSSPAHVASVSHDRFFRIHTAPGPPDVAGQNQSQRGNTLGKVYLKSAPTALVWCDEEVPAVPIQLDEEVDEGVWGGMAEVQESDGDGEDGEGGHRRKRLRRPSRELSDSDDD